jgi:hypothetical protein
LLANCLLALPAHAFTAEESVELRPHHLVDILTSYGHGEKSQPHPYGHAVHIVAPKVLAQPRLQVRFLVAADDICRPCKHLKPDGKCDDVLAQLSPAPPKQEYNDNLDRRLLAYLGMEAGVTMTVHAFFEVVNARVPGIEKICTHPKEAQQQRLAGIVKGLEKLGIRKP